MLPSVNGIVPENLLSLKSSISISDKYPNVLGIVPDRKFRWSKSCASLLKLPSPAGIIPVSLLSLNPNEIKAVSLLKDKGIDPFKAFWYKYIYCKWGSEPMVSGMTPVKVLS